MPTGIGEPFEKPLLDKLKEFGKRKKALVFVAQWDPGHESFNELLKDLHCSAPAIVFSESQKPTADSFNIVVDKLNLIKDIQAIVTEIPQLCQLIVNKEYSMATKEYVNAKRKEDFKRLVGGLSAALKHITVTASMAGTSISATL